MIAKEVINRGFPQLRNILSNPSNSGLGIRFFAQEHTQQQEPARLEKTINSVQLLGRVGQDPQRKGNEKHPCVVFSLATHTNYRYESGEFMQRTEWHRIICFKPALRETIMNYLRKGQRVHVTGKITYGEYKDESGHVKPSTAINAEDVIFFHQDPSRQSPSSS